MHERISDSVVLEYLGTIQPQFLAIEISRGKVDPDSLRGFEVILEEKKSQQLKAERLKQINHVIEGFKPI